MEELVKFAKAKIIACPEIKDEIIDILEDVRDRINYIEEMTTAELDEAKAKIAEMCY